MSEHALKRGRLAVLRNRTPLCMKMTEENHTVFTVPLIPAQLI